MTETPTVRGSEGQTFLIGPALYLRGVETDDAKTGPSWYPSPFPLPATVLEERLKKEIPKNAEKRKVLLIACRRADDRAVGSVSFSLEWWPNGWAEFHADPALGEAAGQAIKAELAGILIPWLLMERELMTVGMETTDDETAIHAVAAEIGMRRAYRLREAAFARGARRDVIGFEALHPNFLTKLGSPPEPVEGPIEREIRSPAPLVWPAVDGDPPPNAMLVGERVYLRPYSADDAPKIARWSRQETETWFDDGRPVRSALANAALHDKLAEEDPPGWPRFAICLRENDEVIGANGIDVDWANRIAETETEIYRPEHRGGGLGTEAKHLLLTYAFDWLGLHMVKSYVWEVNTRSAAALRKQGYRDAGRLAWSGIKNGEFTGDVLFDLLASEWRAARR